MNLLDLLISSFPLTSLAEKLKREEEVLLGKTTEGFLPLLILLLREIFSAPVIALFSQADSLEKALLALSEMGVPAFKFPALDSYYGEKVSCERTTRAERISALWNIRKGDKPVVLTTIKALLQNTPSPEFMGSHYLILKAGADYSWDSFLSFLPRAGYTRVPKVEQLGEYSVRGGIIDIFSPNFEFPLRLEFFSDRLESVRSFDPTTQVSLEEKGDCLILPWRIFQVSESALTELRAFFKSKVEALIAQGKRSEVSFLEQNVARDLQFLNEGLSFLEEDYYFPFFARRSFLWEHLREKAIIVAEEEGKLESIFQDYERASKRIYEEAVERGEQLPYSGDPFSLDWKAFRQKFSQMPTIFHTPFSTPLELPLDPVPLLPQFADLVTQVKSWLKSGTKVFFMGKGVRRYRDSLELEGLKPKEVHSFREELGSDGLFSWEAQLSSGFLLSPANMAFVSDFELFGWRKKVYVEKKYRQVRPVSSWEELQIGDYVVHQTYGIGIYQGLKTLTIDEASRDYIQIAYAGEDRLFIPSDQIYLIQKYLGDSVRLPSLTRLNTTEWAKTKKRVEESVEKVARELLQIYAQREISSAEPFSPYEPWETELAQSFPYEETPDQRQTIVDVLNDLEGEKWMDRLVCGDVGYGKTEVAIRVAFRTVMAGKQVAVLVPTTILCQQHYNTFLERMREFPIRIGILSRFRSPKEQAIVVRELREGKIDIVIGTHRLLSGDIQFKDLGLLIIDEEHRFGVMQKEQIRKLKGNVHVLSLSATPIPRTLQMSLLGIKEASTMETPPQNRYPVKTYVMEFSDDLIKKAIRYELGREGQVFFVHNRIQALPKLFVRLKELVPEARIGLAHGAMPEERLEQVMWDFAQGKYDALLCTTIIESGIDIPRANTLIVADAHNLGLAQLYQLRGRVGRSDLRAYAYFLYPRSRRLGEEAEKRLEAIRDFTQLGTGLKIALRDLEIRGAGNVLGKEQHGFMLQVGYHMYREMLEEAIERIKSGQVVSAPEKERSIIEVGVNAYVPQDYMDEESKIEFYERLAALSSKEKLQTVKSEIRDRFGTAPPPVERLLLAVEARIIAERLGIKKIVLRENLLAFHWKDQPAFDPGKLVSLSETFPRRLKVKEDHFFVRLEEEGRGEILDFVLKVLHILERAETS